MTDRAVVVVGLGKIGLPLAVQIAGKGRRVIGADISPGVCQLVNSGEPPFPGEPELKERLQPLVASGKLAATTDTKAAVEQADVVILVVPLLVSDAGEPGFDVLDAATASVAEGLQPGTLVSYETTLPVHTTARRLVPALEAESGLVIGESLFVCHSPERVSSGTVFRDLSRYPKLVGGVGHASSKLAVAFYDGILDFDERSDLGQPNGVWDLGSAEAAELAKLAETTYRNINIGYANELGRYAETLGVDIYSVIDACNSQPYSHIHRPGIYVGGHCIPVYPHLYMHGDRGAQIPRASVAVNESMPQHCVDRLDKALGGVAGCTVVVLGAAYRGGVKETAVSGVFPLVDALTTEGARVRVHDPMYSVDELIALGFEPHHIGESCDAAVIQTDHPDYETLSPEQLPGIRCLLDGRNITNSALWADDMRLVLGKG